MLVITYARPGAATMRFVASSHEISIGSGASEDLVLEAAEVSSGHAMVSREHGRWVIEDMASARGTFLNGERITGPTVFGVDDTVGIGPFALRILHDDPSQEEYALLAALVDGDEAGRTVYADWLEAHGHPERAEFLRAQHEVAEMTPVHPLFSQATARVRALAKIIDVAWRMRVARPAVEGCAVKKEFTCGVDWGSLAPTEDPKVRTCGACKHTVHYCATESEAIVQARLGRCLVVDFASERQARPIETLARRVVESFAMPGIYLPPTMAGPERTPSPPHLRSGGAPAPRICSACGRQLTNIERFCNQCGSPG